MSDLMKPIGDRLRSERSRLGLSQGDFAEKCGIHKNSLRLYEQGERSPTLVLLLVFQDIGVDISYVLTGRRSDAELGFSEQHHLDMLSKLSVREREAVFGLVATLAGEVIDLADLQAQSDIRASFHDKTKSFQGENE